MSSDLQLWEDAMTASRTDVSTSSGMRLRASLLRRAPEPVDAFQLIPFGPLQVEQRDIDWTFDRQQAEQLVAWFNNLGRRLAIDYEHQSYPPHNQRADGLSPAAGWIGGLEVRDDGLWAIDLEWTPRASDLLRNGEYRYFSPVLVWEDDAQQEIASLGPVALTNDPALRNVPALAASRTASSGVAADDDAKLLEELRAHHARQFVEEGARAGKILTSTRSTWHALFLSEPREAVERLSAAPVLVPQGRLTQQGEEGDALEGWIESADLQAFDRASASGCVMVHDQGARPWR